MRAHRAFRQLAMLLARSGFHVFRFDYFGTGDSAGDSDEGTVDQWTMDIATAIEELKDTADIARVSLVGLRLGASLAALAAKDRDDLESLVLWDPVVDGGRYADALAEEGLSHESYRSETLRPRDDGAVGVLGFPLTTAVRRGLASMDLTTVCLPERTKTLIIVPQDTSGYRDLHSALSSTSRNVEYRCVPTEGNWNEVDANGSALIPQAVIQTVVKYLSTGVA